MDTEVMSTEKRTIVIPYRDGRIRKELHLKPNNQHDMLFYDSYKRLPSDNRNYMASLYAREQRYGVNDDIGHRVQELSLKTPKENEFVLREQREREMSSLDESIALIKRQIKDIEDIHEKNRTDNQKQQLAEMHKQLRGYLARKRTMDMKYTQHLNMLNRDGLSLGKTGQLTQNQLMDIVKLISDDMSTKASEMLEKSVEKLGLHRPESVKGESYSTTVVAIIHQIAQLLGKNLDELLGAVKKCYNLVHHFDTPNVDFPSRQTFNRQYAPAIRYVMTFGSTIEAPDIDTDGATREEQLLDTLETLWNSAYTGIVYALYSGYANIKDTVHRNRVNAAIERNPTWIELTSVATKLFDIQNSQEYINSANYVERLRSELTPVMSRFIEHLNGIICSDVFARKPTETNARNLRAFMSYIFNKAATEVAYEIPRTQQAQRNAVTAAFKALRIKTKPTGALYTAADAIFSLIESLRYKRFSVDNDGQTITIVFGFNIKDNELYIRSISIDRREKRMDIKIPDALVIDDDDLEAKTIFEPVRYTPEQLAASVISQGELKGTRILDVMPEDDDDDVGEGVTYKAPSEEEERFNRIVEMGNPLKKVRSQRYYRMD